VRWQTGNGAKFWLFRGAIKALRSGRRNSQNLSFAFGELVPLVRDSVPAPFLCYFLFAQKESKNKKKKYLILMLKNFIRKPF